MRIGKTLQHLRLPQRLLIIFFLSVIIPLTIMLNLSFSRLEEELKVQAFKGLRHLAKTTAMSIMGRLLSLENEMRHFISNNLGSSQGKDHFFLKNPQYQTLNFDGLILLDHYDTVKLHGEDPDLFKIDPQDLKLIPTGKPILIHRNTPGESALVLMAISLSENEWLIGQINKKFLWNKDANYNLPPDTELCIVDDSKTLLASSFAEPANLIKAYGKPGLRDHLSQFGWEDGTEAYWASEYELFMESSFANKPWTIILNRPQKTILAPIRSFRASLLLIGLLLIFIVFFLSLVAIRKSLDPLNFLITSTVALGRGDFSKRAATRGSPEFRELATAFNGMADQIEKQFNDIRESETRFRAVFDDSEAGIALVSLDGRFVKVNRFLERLLGYPREEILSKTIQELIHPDEGEKGLAVSDSFLEKAHDKATIEKCFVHKDGRFVFGLISTSLLKAGSDSPRYHIVHIQDITAQKQAQMESKKLETQLMHAQKMEAIGTLAAGIAHDFNNILSAIMGYTELAAMDAPNGTALQGSLEKVLQASQRAKELVAQILAFSRRGEGKTVPVQINPVVKEAIKLLRSSIPPHISIVQDISNAPLSINADPTQIHQLIMNLCTNAYHAMVTCQTGTLTVSLSPLEIPLPGKVKPRMFVKLKIGDTGCGMTPEVRARIFEPYFTTKKQGLGTGLGLSIVHTIVKKLNGDILVESEPGRGTTFEIHFPLVEKGQSSKSPALQVVSAGQERILIVDDEKEIATIWQQSLSRHGYQVDSKNDPLEALELFRQNPYLYQLVITDLAMPGMTGEMLSEKIGEIRPDVPVILCTGYFEELRNKHPCSVIKEYLTKPVNLTTMAETVRKVIDHPVQEPVRRDKALSFPNARTALTAPGDQTPASRPGRSVGPPKAVRGAGRGILPDRTSGTNPGKLPPGSEIDRSAGSI